MCFTHTKKPAQGGLPFEEMAERTGLEPATSGVTGQHSNQLNYRSALFRFCTEPSVVRSPLGIRASSRSARQSPGLSQAPRVALRTFSSACGMLQAAHFTCVTACHGNIHGVPTGIRRSEE